MNTDLIAQLEKLSPTDRLVSLESLAHDVKLEQLAPTMRLEILAMAKEIEELRNGVSVLMESHNKKDAEIKELKDKVQFWINSWNRLSKMYDQINSEITPQP